MGYQPLEHLLPKANYSIYKLVCMASKRAKELADGSPTLMEIPASTKTATIALEEILAGRVFLKSVASLFEGKHLKKNPKDHKSSKSEHSQDPQIVLEQNV